MRRITLAAAVVALLSMVGAVNAATTVTWVGGDGTWDVGSNWDAGGGGTTAALAYGRTQGWTGGGAGVLDIDGVIDNGSYVFFDSPKNGDFRWDSPDGDTGSLTISGGSVLHIDSNGGSTDPIGSGWWSQWDAKLLRIEGDDGAGQASTFKRTLNAVDTGNGLDDEHGGVFNFASWRNDAGETMDIELADFGRFENRGVFAFGAPADSAADLTLTVDIGKGARFIGKGGNDGRFDLGLGGLVPIDTTAGDEIGDVTFWYNWDATAGGGSGATDDSTYAINHSAHGGSAEVGEGGLLVNKLNAADDSVTANWTQTYKSWEDLFSEGLLTNTTPRSPGDGGEGTTFADNFIVEGTAATGTNNGSASYKVINIAGAAAGGSNEGDYNGDGVTNGLDIPTFAGGFTDSANGVGGDTLATGDNTLDGLTNGLDIPAFAAGFTASLASSPFPPDPGPAPPESGLAEYNPDTGVFVVSMNTVTSWTINSVGGAWLTGDAPNLNGEPFPTDDDFTIGEGNLAADFSYTDLNLGAVVGAEFRTGGAMGPLGASDFEFLVTTGGLFNSMTVEVPVTIDTGGGPVVPEPTTLALAVLGLCGVMASRRRRVA